LRDELEKGRQALIWEQFRRRGLVTLQLPDAPPRADILKIAAAFGLADPAESHWEIIHDMTTTSGIGKFVKFLQYAHGLAQSRKQPLAWAHFVEASDSIAALSRHTR
jgi:hypothetical protein